MKTPCLILSLLMALPVNYVQADEATIDTLLQAYVSRGATEADAEQGRRLWLKKYSDRSCASCHTDDLTVSGRHVKTNKLIKPMAPSVNPERLTDRKKIEKWFKRNCKWTMGRECSAQEKADFLLYINNPDTRS